MISVIEMAVVMARAWSGVNRGWILLEHLVRMNVGICDIVQVP